MGHIYAYLSPQTIFWHLFDPQIFKHYILGFFSALLIDRVCNNFTKDYLFWHIYFFINIFLMYVAPFFKVASWSLIKSRIWVMLKNMLLDLEYCKICYIYFHHSFELLQVIKINFEVTLGATNFVLVLIFYLFETVSKSH